MGLFVVMIIAHEISFGLSFQQNNIAKKMRIKDRVVSSSVVKKNIGLDE